MPAVGVDFWTPTRQGVEPSTWLNGTQAQPNLQLRSEPSVFERNKWDVHGYRLVKSEHDIDPTDLENALNTYYNQVIDLKIPNCTNPMKIKVAKFTFSGDEIPKEVTSVFGDGGQLALQSPMAVNGTFKSHYTECKLTNARLDSTVEYIKSYISMMSMRDKILESSTPKARVLDGVDEVGPPTSMYGTWNESSIAISRDRFEEYKSYESITKEAKVEVISEKLVRIKWNEENDVKAVFPGIEENAPGEMTPMLDVVFAPLQSRKPIMDMIHGAKVEKEMLLMPCPLTKYLGTEFCPEFTAETAFDASSAAALTTLYKALSSNAPKVSRELLERALDAIPIDAPNAEGAEETQGAEETVEAEAEETKEEVAEANETDTVDESKETTEEIAVNELCEAVMLETDKNARDTKMRALQAYYDKWVVGIGHKSKDKLLKQIDGLKVWLENDKKSKPAAVHYVTPEEKAAAAKAKIREVNEQMKKMRELQAIWADASATVDEKAAAQKEILDICTKQVEASTLKRDPIEEVLENLWGFFRQEMLSTYKKSGANIEVGWNRQKWMILANWLQFAMAPKSTYFSKIDAYGATYFGKKRLPDEYMSLATVKLATEKYVEYLERYKAQIGEDEDIQLNPGLISMASLCGIGEWKGPKDDVLSGSSIRAYILFRCMPNTLSTEEKLIVTRAFASKRTKADSTATVGSQQMYNEFLAWMTDDLKFTPEQVKAVKSVFPIGELSNYMKQAGYSMTRRATGMVYLNTQLVAETPAVKIRDAKNFLPSSNPTENTLPGYDFADSGESSFAAWNS